MLALLFTSLIAVCVDSSERRLTPREEQFLSGIECLRAELKKDCLTVTDGDGNSRCEWKDYACSALSRESSLADVNGPAPPMPTAPVDAAPTAPSDNDPSLTAPKPTAPVDAAPAAIDTVGCCRGFSLKTQVVCQSFEDQMDCENEYCDWVETDDHTDCLLIDPIRPTRANYDDSDSADDESTTSSVPITTTSNSIESILTTEEEMGCCRGNTVIDDDKCHENTAPALCIKHDNCQWLVGNKRDLCAPLQLPTTTSTPDDYDEETSTTEAIAQSTDSVTSESTTESEPSTTESEDGCCKGDAPETNEKCNGHIEAILCAKDENCEWMVGSGTDLCEFELPSTTTPTTTDLTIAAPTAVIGCCNLNDGESDRWKDSCTAVNTEEDCLEVSNDRCHWDAKAEGDTSDCATTTTSTPPGCCFGADVKTQSKCAEYDDEVSCERRCLWLVTDDPSDCVLTSTASPTTTEEMGCCGGDTELKNSMCNLKSSSSTCEKSGNCAWNSAADADCAWTTEEPEQGCCASTTEYMAERCARLTTDESCDANKHCQFHAEWTDCSWPLSIDATTTTNSLNAEAVSVEMNDGLLTTSTQMTLGGWASAKHRRVRTDESVLFGRVQGSVVNRSLDYALSLSSVLIFAIATFVVYAVYRWLRSCREYTKISDPRETDARTHITYESA